MNIHKLLIVAGLLVLGLLAVLVTVGCGTPSTLMRAFSYQGVLTDGGGQPVADGSYHIPA